MEKLICKICNQQFKTKKALDSHMYRNHRFYNKTVQDVIKSTKNLKSWVLNGIQQPLIIQFYQRHKQFNNFSNSLDSKFNQFYQIIKSVRQVTEQDIDTFFSKFLPWKQKNPNVSNSKQLCYLILSPNQAQSAYNIMKGKNPFTGHGAELSPFSKQFIGYSNLPESEIAEKRMMATKHNQIGRNTNQVEYWLKKGYDLQQAKKKVSNRQRTFTLEKCIKKYGEEKGREKWAKRQQKWQNTLNSKSPQQIQRINKAKLNNGRSYSKISQQLFWQLYNIIKNDFKVIKFATLDKNGNSDWSGKSHQKYMSGKNNKRFFFDFYIQDNKKIIQFDGDYWHNKVQKVIQNDKIKNNFVKENGMTIYHVKQKDFRKNPNAVIVNCLKFIKQS